MLEKHLQHCSISWGSCYLLHGDPVPVKSCVPLWPVLPVIVSLELEVLQQRQRVRQICMRRGGCQALSNMLQLH